MKPQYQLFRLLRQQCSKSASSSQRSSIHSPSRCPHPRFQAQLPTRLPLRPFTRLESTASTQTPSLTRLPSQSAEAQESSSRPDEPAYELTFTCKPCSTQSTHRITKHGYHKGTVLVTCPQCKNRHVISDHLRIFADEDMTLEDILKKKGQSIKKGQLAGDGDIELWDDGTSTYKISPGTKSGSPRIY